MLKTDAVEKFGCGRWLGGFGNVMGHSLVCAEDKYIVSLGTIAYPDRRCYWTGPIAFYFEVLVSTLRWPLRTTAVTAK